MKPSTDVVIGEAEILDAPRVEVSIGEAEFIPRG